MTPTFCYPYKRGTGWRSQGFRTNKNQGANGPGGHTGYDQAMDAGTPLYAPGDGIVRNSDWFTANYFDNPWWLTPMGGDTLVLDCYGPDGTTASGPTFVLAHLQDSIPEVGQVVFKGQLIALSGSSGTASTGPHLHTEALPPGWDFNNGVYGRVDPENYFTEWPEDVPGGLSPASNTTHPLSEEDDMALPANFENEWAVMKEQMASLVENVATKKDVPTAQENKFTQAALVSLVNNVATKADLAGVSAAVVDAAKSGASAEEIRAAVDAAMAAGLKVDVTVNGGDK